MVIYDENGFLKKIATWVARAGTIKINDFCVPENLRILLGAPKNLLEEFFKQLPQRYNKYIYISIEHWSNGVFGYDDSMIESCVIDHNAEKILKFSHKTFEEVKEEFRKEGKEVRVINEAEDSHCCGSTTYDSPYSSSSCGYTSKVILFGLTS